jgi:2-methylisocitrate lyase-like PEP mutase family enzyme
MALHAEIIARTVSVPIIADADTGYGNEVNVIRTVREYESRGVAAIQLEDQTFPKRCGHLADKQVTSIDEFSSKIMAAANARRNKDFAIIARTDARAELGLDEAVKRANAAVAVGADIAFIEAPQTIEEVKAIPKMVRAPCLFNMVRGGRTPDCRVDQVEQYGYKLAIVPGIMLVAAIGAGELALEGLRSQRGIPVPPREMTVTEMFERLGSQEWDMKVPTAGGNHGAGQQQRRKG